MATPWLKRSLVGLMAASMLMQPALASTAQAASADAAGLLEGR